MPLRRLIASVLTSTVPAVGIQAQLPTAGAPLPGRPAGVTAFTDVAVIPMDHERVLTQQTVVVKDGRITALGPTSKVPVPAGAVRIDGQGQYLIPGLADMHVHINFFRGGEPFDSAAVERRLFKWLAQGITTVRNLDYLAVGDVNMIKLDPRVSLQLRARAAAGELWSPRIYTSGPWGPRTYSNQEFWPSWQTESPVRLDSVAAYVAAYKAAGYDFVKVHDEHPVIFDSVIAAAQRVGLPVVGHARGTLEQSLASGMRSIEHLTGYGAAVSASASASAGAAVWAEATKRAGVWNCPTLVTGSASGSKEAIIFRVLRDAGVGLLLGTDYPAFAAPITAELELLVRAGLTPYQALLAGTKNVAQYFGTLDSTGTIAVGKRADLVLLNGNPLQDIQHARQPAGVMIGGRWLARQEIDRRLAAMSAPVVRSP